MDSAFHILQIRLFGFSLIYLGYPSLQVVIADESHFLKNAQAKRTTASLPVIKVILIYHLLIVLCYLLTDEK